MIKEFVQKSWTFFLDLIFPIDCLGCGVEGQWLCPKCFQSINLKPRLYCFHCKKENNSGRFCPLCGVNYHLDGVWVAALYDDRLVGQAIKSFKYHFISGLAEDLGKILVLFIDNLLEQNKALRLNFKDNLIIPVPLSPKRLRWRGFNQALILAEILAKNYSLEVNDFSLIRVKHKKPQAKLSEVSRLENIKDCFAWRGDDLKKRNIILVDDVATTGATLNECAKVLKANGAGEVWGLVVAKG